MSDTPTWTDAEASEYASAFAAEMDINEPTSTWRMDRNFLHWVAARLAAPQDDTTQVMSSAGIVSVVRSVYRQQGNVV